jgi:hypothetical protein
MAVLNFFNYVKLLFLDGIHMLAESGSSSLHSLLLLMKNNTSCVSIQAYHTERSFRSIFIFNSKKEKKKEEKKKEIIRQTSITSWERSLGKERKGGETGGKKKVVVWTRSPLVNSGSPF